MAEREGLHPQARPPVYAFAEGFHLTRRTMEWCCDPLRDEAQDYAERLAGTGVRARVRRYNGMIHGYMLMAGVLDEGARAIAETGEALGAARAARS